MQTFIDDDPGYFNWLAHHPDGFVVNTYRKPSAKYIILHRATCSHIQRWEGRHSTADYIKICGDEVADLRGWALAKVRGELKPCGTCHPEGS